MSTVIRKLWKTFLESEVEQSLGLLVVFTVVCFGLAFVFYGGWFSTILILVALLCSSFVFLLHSVLYDDVTTCLAGICVLFVFVCCLIGVLLQGFSFLSFLNVLFRPNFLF